MNSTRPRIVAAIGVLAIVVIFMVINAFSHVGKGYIKLHAVPEDAQFRVDNKETGSGLWIKSGVYTFSASKSGYETDSQTITVTPAITDLYFVPKPISDEAKKMINSEKISVKREMYAGLKAAIVGQSISDTNPFIELLPKYDIAGPYTIDYGLDENNKAYYVIGNSTADGRKSALQWIRDAGYNPSELDIRFSDFTNPVTGENQ